MKEITEDYVSYEIAVLLKEKGFTEPVQKVYNNKGDIVETYCDYTNQYKYHDWLYPCPTHQMALKWLRERQKIAYNIFVFSDGGLGELHYRYEIQEIDNELLQCNGSLDTEDKNYDSYEEAVESVLLYVLKNLI